MPMLMPAPKTLSKSIENISKSGINIDEIVRNSIRCDIKNILKQKESSAYFNINRKTRIPLKETSLSSVAPPSSNNSISFKYQKPQSKTNIQKPSKKDTISRNKFQIKRFEQIKKENLEKEALGDSLTSLQWLTGINVDDILDGKPIQCSSPPASSSSKDGIDKRVVRGDGRHYSDGSVDYRQNHEIKPPYSYAALIVMAMKSKVSGKMTLSEIYKWISDNFVFYRNAEPTWQNSIRHNLSLNKCFTKIPRKKGDPGKGGYWSIVPEFANKLLENSIRKRRSNVFDYDTNDSVKRQRLDLLESELLNKMKTEIKQDHMEEEKALPKNLFDQIILPPRPRRSPIDILADTEQCRMDHPYGKSPVVNYNISDEESIRAIATNLKETTSNVDTEENPDISTNNSLFNTFSSAIRTDCIWSPDQNDNLAESMSQVTEELLNAQSIDSTEETFLRTLDSSLNSNGGLVPSLFRLSSPMSGDDDAFSDDLDDIDDLHAEFSDEDIKYLAVHGTRMTLFRPTPDMILSSDYDVKEEPLSPDSIDLNG